MWKQAAVIGGAIAVAILYVYAIIPNVTSWIGPSPFEALTQLEKVERSDMGPREELRLFEVGKLCKGVRYG